MCLGSYVGHLPVWLVLHGFLPLLVAVDIGNFVQIVAGARYINNIVGVNDSLTLLLVLVAMRDLEEGRV